MAYFKNIAQDPDEGPGKTKVCPLCKGKKKIPKSVRDAFAREFPNTKPIPKNTPCTQCGGTGRVHK